jgi:hypothetical protein
MRRYVVAWHSSTGVQATEVDRERLTIMLAGYPGVQAVFDWADTAAVGAHMVFAQMYAVVRIG